MRDVVWIFEINLKKNKHSDITKESILLEFNFIFMMLFIFNFLSNLDSNTCININDIYM